VYVCEFFFFFKASFKSALHRLYFTETKQKSKVDITRTSHDPVFFCFVNHPHGFFEKNYVFCHKNIDRNRTAATAAASNIVRHTQKCTLAIVELYVHIGVVGPAQGWSHVVVGV
jgi:hypothetical protein